LSPSAPQPRIFVTVGTHEQGFPRLLAAVANVAVLWSERREPAEWIVQAGPATVSLPPAVTHFPSCSYVEILRHLSWADVTVCQSAPGSVFAAIAQRATPIVVPRSRSLGEHVDDHQHAFANHLAAAGIAMVVTDTALLGEALLAAISEPREVRIRRLSQLEAASRERTIQWSRRVGQKIESLCARSTHAR
jgi:UDP-N-acetylglucosamine transferase subunit ALG13